MADVTFKSNKAAVSAQMDKNIAAALEALGMDFTSYTQNKIRVDTGVLKSSQTHQVDKANKQTIVGNTAHYAPHVHFPGITRNWAGDPWMTETLNERQNDLAATAEAILKRGFDK